MHKNVKASDSKIDNKVDFIKTTSIKLLDSLLNKKKLNIKHGVIQTNKNYLEITSKLCSCFKLQPLIPI